MAMMKELFMKYQEEMRGQDDLIDDGYHFQKWCEERLEQDNGWNEEMEARYWAEQPPYPFATDVELEEINDRIKIKYSDMDIESALHKVLGDANSLVDEIKKELNNLNSIRNGYFD